LARIGNTIADACWHRFSHQSSLVIAIYQEVVAISSSGDRNMISRGKLIGRVVSLAAAAVLVATAAAACTEESKPTATGPGAGLTLEKMRSVLIPLDKQPQTRFVHGPMTLKEAAANNAFQPAPGLVFEPKICASYLAETVGALGSLEGWVQYGSRVNEQHNDNFIQLVAKVPGADQKLIDKIRAALSGCRTGSLTIEDRAKGRITYEERKAPALQGAATFSVVGMTQFSEQPGTPEYDLVRKFEMPPDSQLLLNAAQACIAAINITAMGDTIMVVHEADAVLGDQLTMQMFGELENALG
jgi:hypothetical protein